MFRFIGGLAIGASSVVAPMYIAEISPAPVRGRLVALSQFNVVAGILAAYFSNYLIAELMGGPETNAWRWMLGIAAVPSALFFVLVLRIPESPRWLVKEHRREEATAVLRAMGSARPEALVREIAESLHEETVSATEPFFQRKYSKPILLAVMVASFNQLAGINALIYYTADIFKMAGAGAHERAAAIGDHRRHQPRLHDGGDDGDRSVRPRAAAADRLGRTGRLPDAHGVGVPSWQRRHHRARQPDRLHRVLRLLAGIRHLGLHQRDLSPTACARAGQALGSFTHWFWAAVVSWSFPVIAEASGASAFGFFAVDDGAAVRTGLAIPARDQGRLARADPAHAGHRLKGLRVEPLYGAVEAGGTKFVCMVGSGPADMREQTRFATTSPAETLRETVDFFRAAESR